MLKEGDIAPDFTLTKADGELTEFKLSEELGDGPLVLAFFPAAFSPPCTNEMVSLQDQIEEFEDAGAKVLGISVDNPFALKAFKEKEDLDFELLSDTSGEVRDKYDLSVDLGVIDVYNVMNRQVLVLDNEGRVTYSWKAEDNLDEKCFDEVLEILRHVKEEY